MQDPYDILGIPRGASQDEARHAYHALAREHHPDVSGDPASAELFCRITAAYEQVCERPGRVQAQTVRVVYRPSAPRPEPMKPRGPYEGSARRQATSSWWPWTRRRRPDDLTEELDDLIKLMIKLSR
jgi:curved DNA-binding protein CbpA